MAKLSYVLFVTLLCGLSVNAGIPGGPQPITDETELATLSNTARTHLGKLTADGKNLELVKVHSATSKVVAGSLYEMIVEVIEKEANVNCSMSIWEKSWEKFIKVNVECGDEKRKYEWSTDSITDSTTDTVPPLIAFGGYTTLTNDGITLVERKLTHAFGELAKKYSTFSYTFKSVVSGKSQPVAGFHYVMDILVGYTDNNTKTCKADMIETIDNKLRVELLCDEEKYNVETPSPK